MKEFFRSLFGASSKEVIGFSTLILFLLVALVIPRLLNYLMSPSTAHYDQDEATLDSLVALVEHERALDYTTSKRPNPIHFNPNLASAEELMSVGFKEKIARRIVNYRDHGGRYKRPMDLYKIYGIDSVLVAFLYDYIDIPKDNDEKPTFSEASKNEVRKYTPSVKRQIVELPNFDINRADTATLKTIKGIGSVLSARIVEFRNSLGGFTSTAQLYEVYNLDTLVAISLIKKCYIITSFMPDKIKINILNVEDLAAHPYISWQQAKLIVAYRKQHGNYMSENELLMVYGVEDSDIARLGSYLSWSSSN